MGLLTLLREWASKAWNWLNQFLRRFFAFIKSWWAKLKQFVSEFLREFNEVVILDQRQKGGRELVEAIRKAQPETVTMDDIESMDKLAVCIDDDGEIGKVEQYHADNVESSDGFDVAVQKNDGILRING